MQEALLYQKNKKNKIDCRLCNRFCNISLNETGSCGVRKNIAGKLYALNYNRLLTQEVDPIEKRALFHFLPGTLTHSISAMGCNLKNDSCQNWQISKLQNIEKLDDKFPGEEIKSEEIIERAQKNNCSSISYAFTEPTVFLETALPIMKLAHQHQLKNVWISNGYMTKECLDLILPYLDAVNIDLKFFSDKKYQKVLGGSLDPILDNLIYLKKNNIFLELSTILIPGKTNTKKQLSGITKFIVDQLGDDTPWHISKSSFKSSFKFFSKRAISDKELEKAYQIGKDAGLKYIYLGNIATDDRENTYCPECEALNIERQGRVITRDDQNGLCQNCKQSLNIIT